MGFVKRMYGLILLFLMLMTFLLLGLHWRFYSQYSINDEEGSKVKILKILSSGGEEQEPLNGISINFFDKVQSKTTSHLDKYRIGSHKSREIVSRDTFTGQSIKHFKETQQQRQTMIENYCKNIKSSKHGPIKYGDEFLFSKRRKVIYCTVPKVACTTWKRVILLFDGYQKRLRDIPKLKLHYYPFNRLKTLDGNTVKMMREKYYSFMFTRHPHDRLFSAYRNKFLDVRNETFYLELFGPYMVFGTTKSKEEVNRYMKENNIDSKKLNVTFEQFVRFVLNTRPDLDQHWQPQTDITKICKFNFSYLGKFETLNQDAKNILYTLNAQNVYNMFGDDTVYTKKTLSMLKKYYEQLPKELLSGIYERYQGDFEAFGYDPYNYIT